MAIKRNSKKEKDFVSEYIKTGNGTKTALKVYNIKTEGKTKKQIENTAASIACELLRKPQILRDLEAAADIAKNVIIELAQYSENDNVRLGASKDILDRAGFKPVERTENKTDINVTEMSREELIKQYSNYGSKRRE